MTAAGALGAQQGSAHSRFSSASTHPCDDVLCTLVYGRDITEGLVCEERGTDKYHASTELARTGQTTAKATATAAVSGAGGHESKAQLGPLPTSPSSTTWMRVRSGACEGELQAPMRRCRSRVLAHEGWCTARRNSSNQHGTFRQRSPTYSCTHNEQDMARVDGMRHSGMGGGQRAWSTSTGEELELPFQLQLLRARVQWRLMRGKGDGGRWSNNEGRTDGGRRLLWLWLWVWRESSTLASCRRGCLLLLFEWFDFRRSHVPVVIGCECGCEVIAMA